MTLYVKMVNDLDLSTHKSELIYELKFRMKDIECQNRFLATQRRLLIAS